MCWMCDARRVALAMYEQAGVKVTGRAAPDALHFDYEVGMDGSGRATAANTLSRPEPDGPTITDRARQFEEARENYEQRVEEFRAARQVMEDAFRVFEQARDALGKQFEHTHGTTPHVSLAQGW